MYARGQEIAKWTDGSFEDMQARVAAAVSNAMGATVDLVATKNGSALVLAPDGTLHEATFVWKDGACVECVVRPSTIAVCDEEGLPRLVADELREVAGAMMRGEPVTRTQVRSLAMTIRADEDYHLTNIIGKVSAIMENSGEDHWHSAYSANQEKIRTAMWGAIRELEGRVPKTAYAKISAARISEFEGELRESVGLLRGVFDEIVDECSPLVFDEGDGFYGAIRGSLIAEAKSLRGLLAKAGQLMRAEDLGRVAEAHDRLCGRARTMEVVAAYLVGRSKKGAEEGK